MLLGLLAAAALAHGLTPDPKAVARTKAGHHDCPHCELAGADLSNQCVKGGDLRNSDFSGSRLVLMCMFYADFRGSLIS